MKVWNFLMAAVTLMIFLQFCGIQTGLSPLLQFIGLNFNPSTHELTSANMTFSNLWNFLFDPLTGTIFTLGISAAVTAGLIYSGRQDLAIYAFVASTVSISFVNTFFSIINLMLYNQYPGWVISMVSIICIPLIAGFIFALIDYVRGTDF